MIDLITVMFCPCPLFLTAKEQFNKGLRMLVNQRKLFHNVMHL